MPARRLLLAAALTFVTPAAAHAAGPGSTLLIDRPAGLGALPFDGANDSVLSGRQQLSADGRFAVYESDADQLLAPGADPTVRHVFVRDRQADTTTQVDVAAGGTPGNRGASAPAISADGTKVAFVSEATNLTGDVVNGYNVFVKSLTSGAVELVSRRTGGGGPAANGAFDPALDADGSHVAFTSWASLDGADGNSASDVYVRTGTTTTLVSRATGGGGAVGTGSSEAPAISGDGATVAFETGSPLDPVSDTNGEDDVYTRTGGTTTTLVSRINGPGTAAGNGQSFGPSISANAGTVAFTSQATNLVAGDTNGRADAFTRAGTTTTLHSGVSGTNAPHNGDVYGARISGDGTRVGFSSSATNLLPGVSGADYRAYVRTIAGSVTILASRADGTAGAPVPGSNPSISANGAIVLFGASTDAAGGAGDGIDDVFLRDTGPAGTTEIASVASGTSVSRAGAEDAGVTQPAASDDGRYVVFTSRADGLGLQSRAPGLFLRDTQANTTTRIVTEGSPTEAVISGDGSTVAYAADPEVPVRRGLAPTVNVYAYAVATGKTTVVGRATGIEGALPNGSAFAPAISRDGTKVAFTTWASNLDPAADGDTDADIYLRDLTASTTSLVSRKDGANTPSGKNWSTNPSIDAEGRRVAFTSQAKSLAPGDDALGSNDVFVRDVAANTTTLVSRPTGAGTPAGNDDSGGDLAISGDGTKVAFSSRATNLSPDDADPDQDVYLRDLAASSTALLSRVGASGPSANAPADLEHLSRDGSTVAYGTTAPNVLGLVSEYEQIVVRTIAGGASTIGSRGDGAAGPLPGEASAASLTADGGCLVFRARGANLTPGGYASPDYAHVYLRALTRECPPPAPVVSGGPLPAGPVKPSTPAPLPAAPAADRKAPVISSATLTPRTFAVAPATRGRAAQRRRVARGTSVRFSLSEPASVVLTAERRERGRRSGSRCVKSTARLRQRKAKACNRYVVKGAVRVAGKAGANRVAFTGRIGRRALPRGRFRLRVDATDAARNKARPRTVTFTIVKG